MCSICFRKRTGNTDVLPVVSSHVETVVLMSKVNTELFDGKTTSKVLSQKTQDEEQAVAGIRDNDIRKNGVGMLTAVTENPHHTEV